MTIDIDTLNPANLYGGNTKQTDQPAKAQQAQGSVAATPNQGQGASNDTLEISQNAQQIQQLQQEIANLPEVDNQKVAEIKQALEDGSYKIDANTIAEKLLQVEESLGD